MSERQPSDELAQLLKRMEQAELSAAEKSQLNELLQSDAEALEQFVRYQAIDAHLAWRFTATPGMDDPLAAIAFAENETRALDPKSIRTHFLQRHGWLLAIAALLVGLFIGFPLGLGVQNEPPEDVAIATLTSIGPGTKWSDPFGRALKIGAALEKGWINLDAGTIELTFSSGATVNIDGPASFAIDSPLRGFLNYGAVRVHAPESARDFAVGTASMEVVDLGTEFDLSVSEQSGAAEINVVDGLVDLYLSSAGRANRIQSLSAGESAAIDSSGEITSIQGGAADPRLLAHWRLDENADDTIVADSSPHHFDGKLNMPTSRRSRAGKAGQALELGVDGFVDFSEHLSALTSTNAFTLTAWVRNANDIVFSVSDGTNRQRIQFELEENWLYYGWQQGDRFDRISASVPPWLPDRWRHVAVSVSGGSVTLYLDGRALIEPKRMGGVINTRAIAPIQLKNPTSAYLGRVPSNHVQEEQFLGGELDDVQLYGRALDEVAIHYLFEHPGETLPHKQN
ncbi:FecR domain-containing protein [Blastopirellula sp. J2-11]|uniref:LamG-like jellyroll fold domain-containing protein n=1 Tax=Blastopirellula sp. J2-11 TaxID=2943192 RepID=UPI0021C7B20D|nr:LamG-like jellyroll fold domain-containing protein [Blastopirellula sp. J2-11]UUO06130.1 FecR domain-containing protein [Blastopirellula sp. J2-11]